MSTYKIYWVIELDAESPFEAAEEALEAVSNGTAKIFTMQDQESGNCFSVDLIETPADAVTLLSKRDFNKTKE